LQVIVTHAGSVAIFARVVEIQNQSLNRVRFRVPILALSTNTFFHLAIRVLMILWLAESSFEISIPTEIVRNDEPMNLKTGFLVHAIFAGPI